MSNLLLGIIGILIGSVLVIKTNFFISNFGKIRWAEKYLDILGGTVSFYKILGLLIIFIGILFVTNLYTKFLGFILKTILPPIFS